MDSIRQPRQRRQELIGGLAPEVVDRGSAERRVRRSVAAAARSAPAPYASMPFNAFIDAAPRRTAQARSQSRRSEAVGYEVPRSRTTTSAGRSWSIGKRHLLRTVGPAAYSTRLRDRIEASLLEDVVSGGLVRRERAVTSNRSAWDFCGSTTRPGRTG